MNTYLFYSGIVLHILIFLALILLTIDEISTRRKNKKLAAEHAKKQAAYKEELKLAKQAWQRWNKNLSQMSQNYRKLDPRSVKAFRLDLKIINYRYSERYRFNSIDKSISLLELGEKYEWSLEEEPSQQAG
ncbi:MAG: hypothetical protein G01um101413_585 [Parcubacteria group bacterium Gr01-1014_13]|nr:MAG: hypothetical protein G01um101413_585 [Parcubacteria group bacterium Gr01-1014_13]